jgi:hypothetical protein
MKRLLTKFSIVHVQVKPAWSIILTSMHEVADSLRAVVAHVQAQFQRLSDSDAGMPLKPGGWSRKQVIGHLIDSASNNHQRFVRLLLHQELTFPGYTQAEWVAVQDYQSRQWAQLLGLWASYNGHLAHLIADAPPTALGHVCRIGDNPPMTLEELMRDYLRHLEHHIRSL